MGVLPFDEGSGRLTTLCRIFAGTLCFAGLAGENPRLNESGPAVRAFYYRDSTPEELTPVDEAPSGMKVYSANDLPLVLTEPVALKSGARTFLLDRDGLYRLADLKAKTTTNTILDRGNLWRLAGHLSRLQVHGWRHDGEDLDRWTQRARRGRLSVSCGITCQFVAHHLAARGHRVRTVQVVTLESHNGHDDGHVLLELFDPAERRWVLFDPDMKCQFRHDNQWLDLGGVVALYRAGGQADLSFLAHPAIDAYEEEAAPKQFAQFSLMFEATFLDPVARQNWYRRMLQIPIVEGRAGTQRPEDVSRVRALGFGEPDPWTTWMKAAYDK